MVLLKGGEKLLLQEVAKHKEHGKGSLILTNSRLIFEKTTGLISKKTETIFSYGLGIINDVRAEGLIGKSMVVEYSGDGTLNKHYFKGINHNQWIPQIKSAIQNR